MRNKNNCPLCRQCITEIGYNVSYSKKSAIIINVGDFKINPSNDLMNGRDSGTRIKFNKSEPWNKLLLFLQYKYNLTHITFANIDVSDFQNFLKIQK